MEQRRAVFWDLPTRLFHWSLVVAVGGCWWTGERGLMELHGQLGYGVLALLLFRLTWGLVGSETARIASLLRPPSAVVAHLRHLFRSGAIDRPVGHNAAGGYAVLAMFLVLAVQAVSGLFLYDDAIYWGPLNDWVGEETAQWLNWLHDATFDVLLVLVAVHIAAILLYFIIKNLDLVRPMLSGRAVLPPGATAPRLASLPLALVLALAAGFAIWALVTFA